MPPARRRECAARDTDAASDAAVLLVVGPQEAIRLMTCAAEVKLDVLRVLLAHWTSENSIHLNIVGDR